MAKLFNKIPKDIESQIHALDGKPFVLFANVELSASEEFPNLPRSDDVADVSVTALDGLLPDPASGLWASRNVNGWVIVRDDLPKEPRTYGHEVPHYGDWSKGSHWLSRTVEAYPRDFVAAPGFTFIVSVLRRDEIAVTVGVELDRVFEEIPDDRRVLRLALKLFRESTGQRATIRSTDRSMADYVATTSVDWELLPVGEAEEALATVRSRLDPTDEEDTVLQDRMATLLSLKPQKLVTGTSNFARYFGGYFNDELVVFENIRYGNAIYIMFDDWRELSTLSRTELLGSNRNFTRITHQGRWKRRLERVLAQSRQARTSSS